MSRKNKNNGYGDAMTDLNNIAQTFDKNEKSKSKPNVMKRSIIIISIALAALAAITVLSLVGVIKLPGLNGDSLIFNLSKGEQKKKVNTEKEGKPEQLDPEGVSDEEIKEDLEALLEPVDANDYFNKVGTVKSSTPVSDSESVLTETEAYELMTERGFTDFVMTTNYDTDGKYSQTKETTGGYTKHPTYSVQYTDKSGRMWLISITNNTVTALFVSYTADHPDKPPVYLSETKTLIGYDSYTNAFYVFEPKADNFNLKTVATLNAETLDAFTI